MPWGRRGRGRRRSRGRVRGCRLACRWGGGSPRRRRGWPGRGRTPGARGAAVAQAAELDGGSVGGVSFDVGEGGEPGLVGVEAFLTSPRIAGLRSHQGEVVGPAVWAPILDETTWKRVRAILTDTRPGAKAGDSVVLAHRPAPMLTVRHSDGGHAAAIEDWRRQARCVRLREGCDAARVRLREDLRRMWRRVHELAEDFAERRRPAARAPGRAATAPTPRGERRAREGSAPPRPGRAPGPSSECPIPPRGGEPRSPR
jgi:hypothetical protein